ncbi:HemY domain-containing protein [Hyphomicrobium denitrificans 1NES1]|uniref:HemY domain-containing protein n=1 Tax=Hyphomicrobium denitrificans 1NES1 TaxID=670307 RepID=N0BCH8_9HYPH|nr:heme biosynthesis HemY N-terminal domain-containing protein [Hyphomicrobium denitrificans]AGK59932.1 HemY domain-containing protein [Hyphomicrobium denitrificans 1NES1]
MVRLVVYLLTIALIASGLAWLADRPGTLQIVWQGYDIETSVFRAVVLLAAAIASIVFLWSVFRALWNSPAAIGDRLVQRRQRKGLDAVSSGLIAVGAGDSMLASRFALQARKSLPHEPLTHLLRAQSAELSGDRATARRIYEAMLASPETEQLGLRGLFLEAERQGAGEAARQFASRALKANPKLGWSATALFEQQCKQKDWTAALQTLDHARKNGHIAKAEADRKRAVLLTAKAQNVEEDSPDKALALALEAHGLASDLVPAAAIAGRILASRGNTSKAAKVLQKTWAKSPHPDLAAAYAYARVGDSTRDRFDRERQLAALNPHSIESPIAVATAAIEARMYDEARRVLEPLLPERLTQRVATLMARIEAGENGEKGRVREWLARAMNAARDPAWIADGVISDHWEPISPVDGRLDAFQWRVPVETRDATRTEILARRLEELIAIEAPAETPATPNPDRASATQDDVIDAEPVTVTVKPTPEAASANTAAVSDEPSEQTVPAEAAKLATAAKATATDIPPAQAQREIRPVQSIQKDDTKLFVAPRAPDDPGTEPPAPEPEQPIARRSFRAVS